MKKIQMKTLLSFAFILAFMVPPSFAQVTEPQNQRNTERSPYSNWDTNDDEKIDKDEFTASFNDNDFYSSWDSNSDDQLDEDEWNSGIATNYPYYNDVDYGMFRDWDNDNNEYLNQKEFADRTFNLWDEDGDGFINSDEYNTWNYENIPE